MYLILEHWGFSGSPFCLVEDNWSGFFWINLETQTKVALSCFIMLYQYQPRPSPDETMQKQRFDGLVEGADKSFQLLPFNCVDVSYTMMHMVNHISIPPRDLWPINIIQSKHVWHEQYHMASRRDLSISHEKYMWHDISTSYLNLHIYIYLQNVRINKSQNWTELPGVIPKLRMMPPCCQRPGCVAFSAWEEFDSNKSTQQKKKLS